MTAGATSVEQVYRQHHQRLWRSLLAYSGDAAVASDAEAEAFAQALARGDEIRDVAAWVWRSAFKIADGLLQQRRRAQLVEHSQHSQLEPSLVEFLAMLGGLSAQQRQCIVMRYVGGHTPSEIAELLDTSPGTVRVQLHRAHAHLRVELGADGSTR